jgi:hypothetical protein
MLILTVATIVQMFRRGAISHYWMLLGGSIAAGLFMFGFGLLVITDAGTKRRGVTPAVLAFGGIVPYVFGCFLVFYEGFWRLIKLFGAFSLWGLVVSILFIIGGFVVVNGMYRLSSFATQVDERKILIQQGNGAV